MVEASAAMVLPAEATSPQRARDFVAATLDDWRLAEIRDLARLLTSELVTNAVMHARTDVTVTVTRDDERQRVRVTVTDGSPTQPRRRRYSPMATTGRGLAMVGEAAAAHGVDSTEEGKAIWFELPLSADERSGAMGDRT
jgi:anti-sigma regulatory factor (Ser/Thr protein kinase)